VKRIIGTIAVALLSIPACVSAVEGSLLIYQQQELGIEPYNARIMVTKDFLRMDDGADEGDYLLFDRKQRLISSVTHDDATVFEISPRQVKQRPPMKLRRRSREIKMENPPLVGEQKPHHHLLTVNDKACYNVIAVKGLLKDVRQVLVDFRQTLSGEHAKLLPRLPADQQDPCDLARNIFHPGWQLEFGLPIQEWDEQGRGQTLVDYKENTHLNNKLFTLPQGYRHYTTDDLQP
jgi:hypothetical protein